MADETEQAAEGKPKKPILLIAVGALVSLLLLAGGVGTTLWATGAFDHKARKAALDKLDAADGAEPAGDGHGKEGGGHGADAGKGKEPAKAAAASEPKRVSKQSSEAAKFEYRYLELEKDLLANLTGSRKVMQLKVAIMTRYDERVTNNVKKHEFALRAAALDVMRQVKAEEIDTPEFRKRLAERIRDDMNSTLQKLEDFGGIEEIYFTSFIVQ